MADTKPDHAAVFSHGGTHNFNLGEQVYWPGAGATAKVIALTVEPSVTIEFDTGARITVGQSALRKLTGNAEEVDRG